MPSEAVVGAKYFHPQIAKLVGFEKPKDSSSARTFRKHLLFQSKIFVSSMQQAINRFVKSHLNEFVKVHDIALEGHDVASSQRHLSGQHLLKAARSRLDPKWPQSRTRVQVTDYKNISHTHGAPEMCFFFSRWTSWESPAPIININIHILSEHSQAAARKGVYPTRCSTKRISSFKRNPSKHNELELMARSTLFFLHWAK